MADAKFLGIKQVTLNSYLNDYTAEEKKGYLWVVRDLDGSDVVSSKIYFGNRLYAETNDGSAATLADNLKTAFGGLLDENGEFVGFPFGGEDTAADHPILSQNADDVLDILKNLESAIVEAQSALTETVDVADFQAAVADIEAVQGEVADIKEDVIDLQGDVSDLQDEVADLKSDVADINEVISGLTADLENVYTKDEIDGKIAGVWHFKGEVESIEELPGNAENGDVYQVGEKEYAWNGTEWVELGFNLDLSNYATKQDVEDAIDEVVENVNEALSGISSDINEISSAVNDLEEKATTTAATLSEAEELASEDNLGQIIYITNQYGDTGYTEGAYVVTGEGTVQKLGTTSASGDIDQAVANLEQRVTVLEADKHSTITGDDVEV